MNDELFSQLVQSIMEAGAILRREMAPARATRIGNSDLQKIGPMNTQFPNIWHRPGHFPPVPSIRGGVSVATIAVNHHVHGDSLQSLADDYDLPIELIWEALEYYNAHRGIIDAAIQLDREIEQFYERHRPNSTDPNKREFPPELRRIIEESRVQYLNRQTLTHEDFWRQMEQIDEALATPPTPDEEESMEIGLSHARKLAQDEDGQIE